MSLNSLQDDMSRRAASMAAMAKGAKNPEQIQAIQKSLIAGVQSGAIKPYVGIPLIQELTNKLAEAKAKMAQAVTGAGMPQPPQGGAPIAQQIMAQAAQADQSQGVEALSSNLPQSYAGGGIIAFEDGGQVERYQSKGYTGDSGYSSQGMTYETPYDRMNRENRARAAAEEAARIADLKERGMPTMSYGEQMGNVGSALVDMPLTALKTLVSAPGYGFNKNTPPAVAPTATPAAMPYDPADATRRSMFQGQAQPSAPGGAGAGGGGGGGGFKMPTLPTMKETPAPTLTDYNALIGDMPKKTKDASEAAVRAAQTELEGFDKPGFESREGRLGQREAGLERDSAIGRALTGIKTGLRIAGSKERTLAGALGNEGSQGIEDLIRGEAANRAAKDRLEDARDNLEQQKVAAKKGNYQAAQAAGKEAANDLRAGVQLTMTGAHYGNTEALNRYQTQQQGEFQKTSLGQSGILGLGNLDMQNRQLNQTGAFQNKQLAAMEQRYAAMDKQAQARLMQVRAGAMAKFNETMAPQISAQLAADPRYGKNWRVGTDPKSLEAQMKFKQAQNAYIMDALGLHDASMAAKDSSEY
jgi:hypothetical protein